MRMNPWVQGPKFNPAAVSITGTASTGIVGVLAQSYVAVASAASTGEQVLVTVSIPAGTFSTNGRLRITTLWSATNNANAKSARIRLGGIGGTIYATITLTSAATSHDIRTIGASGATNSQKGGASGTTPTGTSTAAIVTSAIDTTAAVDLVFTADKVTVAGDALVLEGYTVEYMKPAA